MARRDALHGDVVIALAKAGWRITHDPFPIEFGIQKVLADLGADNLIGAEREREQIVVEIKSFLSRSLISELEKAFGQYLIYKSWLKRMAPERTVYLAIDEEAYLNLFEDISGQVLIEDYNLKLVIIEAQSKEVVQWIK